MAEIVNLRRARKAATRAARAREADGNAARHGLTPAERRRQEAEAARAAATLDAHRREGTDGDADD